MRCQFSTSVSLVQKMPPRSQQSEGQLGFYQMRAGAQADTNGLASNWISFSEKGISHDLNGTLDSMNIKTAFRIEGELSRVDILVLMAVEAIVVISPSGSLLDLPLIEAIYDFNFFVVDLGLCASSK